MGAFLRFAGLPELTDERRKAATAKVQEAMVQGRLKFYNAGFLGRHAGRPDHTSGNMSRFSGDSTNGVDMSKAELSVRQDAWDLIDFLHEENITTDLRGEPLVPEEEESDV